MLFNQYLIRILFTLTCSQTGSKAFISTVNKLLRRKLRCRYKLFNIKN